MKLFHLGAKNTVTGSCHLLQTHPASAGRVNILVDCGKAYGNDPELPFDQFPVSPRDIDYLFLTHAHIDHIGRVPDLDAQTHPFYPTRTHPTPVTCLCWNPPMATGIIPTGKTDSTL